MYFLFHGFVVAGCFFFSCLFIPKNNSLSYNVNLFSNSQVKKSISTHHRIFRLLFEFSMKFISCHTLNLIKISSQHFLQKFLCSFFEWNDIFLRQFQIQYLGVSIWIWSFTKKISKSHFIVSLNFLLAETCKKTFLFFI